MPDAKKREVDRVIKFVLVPLLLIILILMTIIPEFRSSGVIALVLVGFSYLVYATPRFQNNLIGIPDNIFKGIGWGLGLFALFFVMMKLIPALSIGIPSVPHSVGELTIGTFAVGGFISIFVIGFLYPISETLFKSSTITILMQTYGLSPLPAISIVASIFGMLHASAYGINVAVAQTFGILAQEINLIGGLIFTAILFGFLATFLLLKTRNIIWVAVAHILINLVILNVIFSFVVI